MDTSFTHQIELLKKLFPFFLIVDENGVISQLGKSSKKLFKEELLNRKFSDTFSITSPIFVNTLADSVHFEREVFILKYLIDNSILLKGQLLQMPGTKSYLFVGNPVIKETKNIKDLKLNNNDFAIFDSLPEYLFGLQTQLTSLRDATELSKKLNAQTNQLKKTNQELTALSEHKDELLASILQKNEELERFAHIASHDLKQPLNTVINFTNLLKMTLPIEPGSEEELYLSYIITGGQQMMQLIEDVLEYSRLEQERRKIVQIDTNQMITDIENAIHFQLQSKNAKIVVENSLPTIAYDRHRIFLVFKNIIENGIKYNQSEQPIVTISTKKEADHHLITIADNGIGIEEKYFSKLFIMFSRLENHYDYEGTGLGLSLCKKIINNMGGEIYPTSEFGKGTQFHLKIPNRHIVMEK